MAHYDKRKVPLPWSEWTEIKNEFPDQRSLKQIRKRIVGYFSNIFDFSPEFIQQPAPIYEFQEHSQIIIFNPGRKPTIQSYLRTFYCHETLKHKAEWICTHCLSNPPGRACFSCGAHDTKIVFKIERLSPGFLDFQPQCHYSNSSKFPDALKEEIMMKAWHPERKGMWKWNLDLEELEDMELDDET